jgi:hypothetical protein
VTKKERKKYQEDWYTKNRDRILLKRKSAYSQCDKKAANVAAHRWAVKNPAKRKKAVAKTRKKYLKNGLCFYCGAAQDPGFSLCLAHRQKQEKMNVRYRDKLRDEIIKQYGGKCVCCGESHFGFLTMDHPNNDGAEHRRKTGCGTGVKFYQWLRKNGYPKEFQILCWNCNCGKRDNGGVCPHKEIL